METRTSGSQVRIETAALELLRRLALAEDRSLTKQMTVLIKEGYAKRQGIGWDGGTAGIDGIPAAVNRGSNVESNVSTIRLGDYRPAAEPKGR